MSAIGTVGRCLWVLMLGAGCSSAGSHVGSGGGVADAGNGSGGDDSSDGGTHATGGSTAADGGSTAAVGGGIAVDGGAGGSDAEPETCANGTWDHDDGVGTECVAWTKCAPGQFVAGEGSASEDRTCSACESGSYSTRTNASACSPWTACTVGTQQIAAGSATAPVTCAACATGTYCAGAEAAPQPCAAGAWDHDADPATACVAKTGCVAGQYVADAGTATTDRTCTACTSGTFNTTSNAESCTAWTDCEAGQYISESGSATADQSCAPCADGTYTSGSNQSTCVPQGECAPGTQQTAPGSDTAPPTCESCAAGTYCEGSLAAAVPCAAETWDHDQDPATACVATTDCIAGQSVAATGTATTDRTCTACASGTYSNTEDAASCATWTDCGPTVVATPGTASQDQTCGTACAAGYVDHGGCKRPANCSELHKSDPALPSGDYVIDPDGAGNAAAFTASCDMDTDGGGWTLVLNYHHQGGTNPELQVRTEDLPLLGSAVLGDDDSDTSSWGHASQALMAQLNASELRFYGETSGHDRVMHFATRSASCLSYFAGGSGDCRGLGADYRALANHTTNIPGVGADGFTGQGDAAMTEFPFYLSGTYHWGIRGSGNRWEVDDYADNAVNDTVHEIWVRHGHPADCATILADHPQATSGVYTIDPDGDSSTAPIQAHCDMVTEGGGWTLVLKADGDQNTFAYTAPLWTNQALYNADAPDFDTTEAKLDTFNSTPFTELLMRMQVPLTSGAVRSLRIGHVADSLYAVMSSNTYTPFNTPPTRDDWKALAGPSGSLQYNCNRQGFNVQPGYASIRIGYLGNNEDDCGSPDSYIGVGGQDSPCLGGHAPTAGGSAGCNGDNGDHHFPGFVWVYVR